MTAPTCSRCSAALPDVVGKGVVFCPACKHPNELPTTAPTLSDTLDDARAMLVKGRAALAESTEGAIRRAAERGYLAGVADGAAKEQKRILALLGDLLADIAPPPRRAGYPLSPTALVERIIAQIAAPPKEPPR